jgi:hypothetical protein
MDELVMRHFNETLLNRASMRDVFMQISPCPRREGEPLNHLAPSVPVLDVVAELEALAGMSDVVDMCKRLRVVVEKIRDQSAAVEGYEVERYYEDD